MYIKEFTESVYVGDIRILQNPSLFLNFIKTNCIRTIYITSKHSYELLKTSPMNFTQFSGGFMNNSICLFDLQSQLDIDYFEKITEIKYIATSQEPETYEYYKAL